MKIALPKFDYKKLGSEILKKREAEDISFRDMQRSIGVNAATCYRAEAASGKLEINTILALCAFLDQNIVTFIIPNKSVKNAKAKGK